MIYLKLYLIIKDLIFYFKFFIIFLALYFLNFLTIKNKIQLNRQN